MTPAAALPVRGPIWAGRLSVRAKARTGWLPGAASHGSWNGCVSQFWPASSSLAGKVLGWPKRCKLPHAFLRQYRCKRLKLAQLLGQLSHLMPFCPPAAGAAPQPLPRPPRALPPPRPPAGCAVCCLDTRSRPSADRGPRGGPDSCFHSNPDHCGLGLGAGDSSCRLVPRHLSMTPPPGPEGPSRGR